MVWGLLALFLALAQSASAPPSYATMMKYTVYSYAASCRVGLPAWSCYWCTQFKPSIIPPVKAVKVFASDGIYGTYGYVGYTATVCMIVGCLTCRKFWWPSEAQHQSTIGSMTSISFPPTTLESLVSCSSFD